MSPASWGLYAYSAFATEMGTACAGGWGERAGRAGCVYAGGEAEGALKADFSLSEEAANWEVGGENAGATGAEGVADREEVVSEGRRAVMEAAWEGVRREESTRKSSSYRRRRLDCGLLIRVKGTKGDRRTVLMVRMDRFVAALVKASMIVIRFVD